MAARHPNSARFHEFLKEAGDLHDLKQTDYGRGDDPFANVRASEEWNIEGWKGAMIRLNDKVRRLQNLCKNGSLNNEAAEDSFMDIAVYALIARVLYEQEMGDTPNLSERDIAGLKDALDEARIGEEFIPRPRSALAIQLLNEDRTGLDANGDAVPDETSTGG